MDVQLGHTYVWLDVRNKLPSGRLYQRAGVLESFLKTGSVLGLAPTEMHPKTCDGKLESS
jgi:hypothetical protein